MVITSSLTHHHDHDDPWQHHRYHHHHHHIIIGIIIITRQNHHRHHHIIYCHRHYCHHNCPFWGIILYLRRPNINTFITGSCGDKFCIWTIRNCVHWFSVSSKRKSAIACFVFPNPHNTVQGGAKNEKNKKTNYYVFKTKQDKKTQKANWETSSIDSNRYLTSSSIACFSFYFTNSYIPFVLYF